MSNPGFRSLVVVVERYQDDIETEFQTAAGEASEHYGAAVWAGENGNQAVDTYRHPNGCVVRAIHAAESKAGTIDLPVEAA